MKRKFLPALAAALLLSAYALGQAPSAVTPTAASGETCAADFGRTEAKVRGDYSGFREKVAGREAELEVFTERVRAEAAAAADSAACPAALRRWVGFFRDRHLAVSETRPQTPAGAKPAGAQARGLVARMEGSPGQFVTMIDDGELRLEAVLPLPRAVAVLVDRRCASTCEQFVLDARQSRKVKVLGASNTGGLLDYGNALTTPLPSGERRIHVPTTRSRRLPAMPLDLIGITPDIRLRKDDPDPVASARRYLKPAHAATAQEKSK